MEDRKDKQIIQQVFDSSLFGIQDDPWMARRVLNAAHGKGEKKVKKKLSVGFAVALVLILATVTAVAAILLSGKDFVDQILAPMSRQTEEEQWSEEELNQILALAQKNGVELTDEICSALASSDPVYKEELLRLFMKIDLGFYPATWPLEEQAWYDELLVRYGLKAERTRFLPAGDEIREDEALAIAEKYMLENWQADVSKGQYTLSVQYMLSEDDDSGMVSKIWDIEYQASDGTVYVLCLAPDGTVIEDGFATYIHKPRNPGV